MNFKNLSTGAALVVSLALLTSPAAHANVVLTYTGNDFTSFTPPYTSTDKVTASITLANPLGDNFPLARVTAIMFSISDGVQTITNTNPAAIPEFEFSTDATGDIDNWFVQVALLPLIIETSNLSLGTSRDQTSNIVVFADNFGDPGTWTSTVVPEPSTWVMLLLGFAGLGFMGYRRALQPH
jgi:PEP-CTERM motif